MKETVYPQKSQQGMRPMILYLYFVFMGKSIDGFLHPSIVYISQRGGNIKVFFISVQPVVGSRLRFFTSPRQYLSLSEYNEFMHI